MRNTTTTNKTIMETRMGKYIVMAAFDSSIHSESGTKKAIAKKLVETFIEQEKIDVDSIQGGNALLENTIKQCIKSACISHVFTDELNENVIVIEAVQKRAKKTYMINVKMYENGMAVVKPLEMEKYNTKIEALKELPLYIRKDGGWTLTDAITGLKIAGSNTRKGIEAELERLVSSGMNIVEKIKMTVKDHGVVNPDLAGAEFLEIAAPVKEKEVINYNEVVEKIARDVDKINTVNEKSTLKEVETMLEQLLEKRHELIEISRKGHGLDLEKLDYHRAFVRELITDYRKIIENLAEAEAEAREVVFNPENTAINTRNSKSAELVCQDSENKKILDYGCGTGRNIKFMQENSKATRIDGCDIPVQLEKEKERHDSLREKGSTILPPELIKSGEYDVVINSHVLNVIESDEVKKVVVSDIFNKLKSGGQAIIEVRTKSDVEGAKTKEKYKDGWKIKCKGGYTYQEALSKEKMVELVSNVGFKIEEHICNSSQHLIKVKKMA